VSRWLQLGFVKEPMLVKPRDGDYLTVKHKPVAGGRGPMGIKTEACRTDAWEVACQAMAGTEWTVAEGTLQWVKGDGQQFLIHEEAGEGRREELIAGRDREALVLGSYSRMAAFGIPFYLPIYMDFRGRVYTRTPEVTYQGSDLQKGLLCFPQGDAPRPHEVSTSEWLEWRTHIAQHAANLYVGPEKLDKAPMADRLDWFDEWSNWDAPEDFLAGAKKPVQLYTLHHLLRSGQASRLALQIDGTCNGLQHLSALFRDETAAPYVNLVGGAEKPSDIYGEIARRVLDRLRDCREPWALRISAACTIDRDLCKKPVMVLPYGGTRGTVEEAVLDAIVKQQPNVTWWTECLLVWAPESLGGAHYGHVRDEDAVKHGFLAFRDRPLEHHPLLHQDARRLAKILWDCICEVIPKAMAAMQAFRDIAKKVGPDRTLEWSTGFGDNPLWVVQAKSKSQRRPLDMRGFHLPDSVRGLAMAMGKDEVDPHSHVTGIVANFIHSQDGTHLARTQRMFLEAVGTDRCSFGANHDCYMTRPHLMGVLKECTRAAFARQYTQDPLTRPVRLRTVSSGAVEAWPSWYHLARHFDVEFPQDGTWEPEAVIDSEWFFC
jgi:DNA-directed RNA polymerase